MSTTDLLRPKWPKSVQPLSKEDEQVLDQWRRYWHTELSTKIGVFDYYTAAFLKALDRRGGVYANCLEIGPGITGASKLMDAARTAAIEIDPFFASKLAEAMPSCNVMVGDIQGKIPELADKTNLFDRVVALHVLEHLRDLPAALAQIKRIMTADGVFDVMIPAEGGALYSLGRRATTARYFRRKFNRDFTQFIAQEHVNTAREILALLREEFFIEWEAHYPLGAAPRI